MSSRKDRVSDTRQGPELINVLNAPSDYQAKGFNMLGVLLMPQLYPYNKPHLFSFLMQEFYLYAQCLNLSD